MKSKVMGMSGAITVVVLCVLAVIAHKSQSKPPHVSPKRELYIEPASLDVGIITNTGKLRHVLLGKNNTPNRISVVKAGADCSCTEVTPSVFDLDPNESIELAVALDVARADGKQVGPTRKAIQTSIDLFLGDGSRQRLTLNGLVVSAVSMPMMVQFESSLSDGEPPRRKQFKIEKDPTIAAVELKIDPADGTLEHVAGGDDGSPLVYEILAKPRSVLGPFSFIVLATAIEKNGVIFGPYSIQFLGHSEGDIGWLPKQIVLVQTSKTMQAIENVAIWSRSGEKIESVRVLSAPEFVKLEPVDGPGSKSSESLLEIKLDAVGSLRREGIAMVSVESSSGRNWTVPIQITALSAESVESPMGISEP